ncbi:rhodanese-like domain-containing protein [Flavobacterium sp. H122]|uniref:rhodanese-like domain-containing protein n=1 Tax=Flavobacterium sp. H122 TaxID=2529860 RepID=UPI0010A9AF62|nr:rhodanese-like domain-containing protein [Flavobacterium sp. H122]
MGILDLLGFGNKTNEIKDFIERGAIIIDVRSAGEFTSGNIKGSKNIPLNTISGKINEIKKLNKPVITCCLSGMRSGQAASILKQNGIECINGGGWNSLANKL